MAKAKTKKKSQPEHEQWGEDCPGFDWEEDDRWHAAHPPPDWDEVIAVKDEADALRAAGKLDNEARRVLLDRARAAIPDDHPEVLARTVAAIERDG